MNLKLNTRVHACVMTLMIQTYLTTHVQNASVIFTFLTAHKNPDTQGKVHFQKNFHACEQYLPEPSAF